LVDTIYGLTDVGGTEHYVNENASIIGRITGQYVALCGATFLPASLMAGPARRCSGCSGSSLLI
jgi:hypothetical protein